MICMLWSPKYTSTVYVGKVRLHILSFCVKFLCHYPSFLLLLPLWHFPKNKDLAHPKSFVYFLLCNIQKMVHKNIKAIEWWQVMWDEGGYFHPKQNQRNISKSCRTILHIQLFSVICLFCCDRWSWIVGMWNCVVTVVCVCHCCCFEIQRVLKWWKYETKSSQLLHFQIDEFAMAFECYPFFPTKFHAKTVCCSLYISKCTDFYRFRIYVNNKICLFRQPLPLLKCWNFFNILQNKNAGATDAKTNMVNVFQEFSLEYISHYTLP